MTARAPCPHQRPKQDYVIKRHVRLYEDHFTTYQDAALDPHDARDYPIGPDAQVQGGAGRVQGSGLARVTLPSWGRAMGWWVAPHRTKAARGRRLPVEAGRRAKQPCLLPACPDPRRGACAATLVTSTLPPGRGPL
jgi:hypothetical protein